MREQKTSKQISFNLFASLIAFGVSICISLFVTPVVVEKLGNEAYGFVSLANSFVSYASLFTVALNSMESRFVSIHIFRNDYEGANKYFTSVFFANVLIAAIMLPFMIVGVSRLENLVEIPTALIDDAKVTFAIVFIQFLVEILTSRFEIATFVTNKLNLYYINQVIASLVRVLVIVIGFRFVSVKIVFLVLGAFLGKLYIVNRNIHYTKTFIPELKVRKTYFDKKCIVEVASSGVWNLVSKLSAILLDGLDLLIANIFISASAMGSLSLSKTVPVLFISLRGTLDYPFTPPMTECYAKGDIEGTIKYARMGNKLLGIFMIAPMAVFLVYGKSFFSLWVPSQDANLLEILSLLSIISLIAGSCINSIFTVFTITNHVKVNSLVILATGVGTTLTVFILLKTTTLGVYAIAGVSSVFSLLRNFIFTPIYGAHCLNVKWNTFYHEIITGIICLVINSAIGYALKLRLHGDTWITFILSCACMGLICVFVNIFVVLSKNDRRMLVSLIRRKLKKE